MKRIIIIVILLAMCCTGGCASLMASIDVDAAIKVAADVNQQNVLTVIQDKVGQYDAEAARLDADLLVRLRKSTGGDQAVAITEGYRKQKAIQAQARSRNMEQYAKVLDNASLIVSLIGQRIALRARWNALFGRIPAVSQLRAVAEVEARSYMNKLNSGVRHD